MANEVIGKIFKFLPERTGQGNNGPWINLGVVVETTNDRVPRKVALQFWGDRANEIKKYPVGSEVKLSFDPESREYMERWYTDLRVWKIETVGATPNPAATYASPPPSAYANTAPPAAAAANTEPQLGAATPQDDLPF